jgi:hypothetical protein
VSVARRHLLEPVRRGAVVGVRQLHGARLGSLAQVLQHLAHERLDVRVVAYGVGTKLGESNIKPEVKPKSALGFGQVFKTHHRGNNTRLRINHMTIYVVKEANFPAGEEANPSQPEAHPT